MASLKSDEQKIVSSRMILASAFARRVRFDWDGLGQVLELLLIRKIRRMSFFDDEMTPS